MSHEIVDCTNYSVDLKRRIVTYNDKIKFVMFDSIIIIIIVFMD